MSNTLPIEHLQQSHRFVLSNTEAVLEYQLDEANHKVNFSRTFVPPSLRGSGAAQALVRAGLKWAKGESLTIEASCWYVDKFLGRKNQ